MPEAVPNTETSSPAHLGCICPACMMAANETGDPAAIAPAMAYANTASAVTISATTPYYVKGLLIGSSWSNQSRTPVTVTYSFPTSMANYRNDYYFLEYQTGSALNFIEQTAVTAALQKISEVAGISFLRVADTAQEQGTIRIAGSSQVDYYNAYAWAYYPGNYDEGGDIWFSDYWRQGNTNPNNLAPGTYDFLAMIHEIGHAVGLKHSFESPNALPSSQDNWYYTMMAYSAAPGTSLKPTTPMLYDIATLQFLYGENANQATGNNTYGFNGGLQCIWDAAGTDTVSADGSNFAVRIDLHDGAFSSLNGNLAIRDFSIAYNAQIENAIGGANDDRISGNNLSNRLEGSAGRDLIFGGAGADTLIGGDGDDTLYGGSGIDIFVGGNGQDRLVLADTNGGNIIQYNAMAELGDIITGFNANGLTPDQIDLDGLFDSLGISALLRAGDIAVTQNSYYNEIRLDLDDNGAHETLICTLMGRYNAADLANCLILGN